MLYICGSMRRKKIKANHYLYFKLLNVLYKITFKNNSLRLIILRNILL